jgi:hypothetical protein
VPSEKRPIGWNPLPVLGPMARTVPDLCLLLSTMVGDDAADPLATTIHGQTIRRPEDFARPAMIALASLKVAITPDFGFAPTEKHIRKVFADKVGAFSSLFAATEEATPDCAGMDETFEVLRSLAFLAGMYEKVRDTPEMVGPNVRVNVEEGLRYGALDITRALKQQTAIYQRWQGFFEDYDVILSPAVTLSPRPWAELYPAEIDGQPIGQIVWDQIVVDSNRNAQLKDFDLVPDGLWSIAALSETQSSLPANASGFFAFNDDSGEVGELYVANMQFRDDALSAASVAALGGAAAGPIAVPEPAGWLLVAAGVACACRFPRRCCHTPLDSPPH